MVARPTPPAPLQRANPSQARAAEAAHRPGTPVTCGTPTGWSPRIGRFQPGGRMPLLRGCDGRRIEEVNRRRRLRTSHKRAGPTRSKGRRRMGEPISGEAASAAKSRKSRCGMWALLVVALSMVLLFAWRAPDQRDPFARLYGDWRKLSAEKRSKPEAFAERCLELARLHPDTPAELAALCWAAGNAPASRRARRRSPCWKAVESTAPTLPYWCGLLKARGKCDQVPSPRSS